MAGHKNWNELRKKMSPERRARNDAAVREELRAMLLSELRKLAGLTQKDLADRMGINQSALSRIESQTDVQISTLQRLAEALGGQLDIVVELPEGRISIKQFRKTA